jgi:hypothetical protein
MAGKNISFKNSDLAHRGCWHGSCFALGVNLNCAQHPKETSMNSQISTKLTALAIALVMNSLLIGGVAYVFSMQVDESAAISLERAAAPAQV